MAIHWSVPVWVWPLLLFVAAGAVFWTAAVYDRTRPAPPAVWRRRLVVLRATSLVLLILAAAGPVLNRLGQVAEPARLAVVVDDSASMALADGPAGITRWQQATDLAATVVGVMAGNHPDVVVDLLRGNGEGALQELDPDRPPAAVGTDLDALVAAARRRGAGRPVRAVLVLADGGETRRARTTGRNPSVSGDAPRVLVTGVGDPVGAADRLITDLRHPDVAQVGEAMTVEFTVAHEGPVTSGAPIRVRLSDPAGVVTDTTVAAAIAVPMRLTFTPREQGLVLLELDVSLLDNESFPANNRLSMVVDVRPDRRRVLLLSGSPDWNVRFLAQAAGAEPRLEMVVVHPTPSGIVRTDSQSVWTPPRDPEAWSAWDAVVVAGWTGWNPPLLWTGLAEAVDQGLGLCVLPGAGPGVLVPAPAELAALLPVTVRNWQWRRAPLYPTESRGAGHALLAGLEDGLRRLPPLGRNLTAEPAPTATVILAARPRGAEDPANRGVPLLVTAERGSGRVAWVGSPDLWQAAFAEVARDGGPRVGRDAGPDGSGGGEGAGRRLLRNLLVWTASGEGEAGLDFVNRENRHSAGEPVTLEARWRDIRGRPVVDGRVQVGLRRVDADSSRFAARTLDMSPGLASGRGGAGHAVRLSPLPPGRYEASLSGIGETRVTGGTHVFVVAPHTVEATQTRQDVNRLQTLARHWRGEHVGAGPVSAAAPADLVAALAAVDWFPEEVDRRHRWDPWSGWPFLVVVALLLGLEWFLRRRLGLL